MSRPTARMLSTEDPGTIPGPGHIAGVSPFHPRPGAEQPHGPPDTWREDALLHPARTLATTKGP